MIPNFCSPWSDFKGREAHPDRGGNVFGPRATCVSYQSVATDWRLGGNGERQNRQKLFRSRSLSSSNSLTIIWSTESDHVWVYNLENSNAPALPVWTHTHTHTWEREKCCCESQWIKDQERLPRVPFGLRSEGMNKWPDEKGVGWRGSERMFQTEQAHLPEPGGPWRKADLSLWGPAIVAGAVEGAGAWPGCQDSEGTQSAQILFCHLSSKE